MTTLTQSQIVSQIVQFGLTDILPTTPDIAALSKLSLQDMLDAVRAVERDNDAAQPVNGVKSLSVVPSDRLTAAVYTWLHYCAPGHHDVGDHDDAILHLVVGNARHGLIKWAREAK